MAMAFKLIESAQARWRAARLDDALGMVSRRVEVAELPEAAGGLAGQRAFIEVADPR